jgi:hypothetical protein
MYRIVLSAGIAVTSFAFASFPREVQAQGLHVRAGQLHVDVGNPHQHRRAFYPYSGFGAYGGYGAYQTFYPPVRSGHGYWHDTTHYDYHPGGFQRHYDHFHYVPEHYDLHPSGHWHGHGRGHGHH